MLLQSILQSASMRTRPWVRVFGSTPSKPPVTALAPIKTSDLTITKTTQPRVKVPLQQLQFGHSFADHMLTIEWRADKGGWCAPSIIPYGNLSLPPSISGLHYGLQCFEGMKAYKDKQGRLRLFRPDRNMARLNSSAARLALPTFDGASLLALIKKLVSFDRDWVPDQRGFSLYLRPTLIGTQDTLGVGAPKSALLFVISSPVGPYYPTGFNAVRLVADERNIRAWPGGVGAYKVGGNYAPCIKPQIEAAELGYQQNLWLFGKEHFVTEVGTMNCFVFWTNEKGQKELITPPLDGTILPGVTRDSILQLAREWKEFQVNERPFTMAELTRAIQDGRVHEMFGAGTACIVAPIKAILYGGKEYAIPLDPKIPSSQAGPLAARFNDTILKIQYGEVDHPWSVIVD